jgi:hypothetical protein
MFCRSGLSLDNASGAIVSALQAFISGRSVAKLEQEAIQMRVEIAALRAEIEGKRS